ncbi:DUF6310 domain-containing protein [Stigmatella sp. ncwal1]|uniref:DUF6310 domain-containing protein n=1 Tax=Stigmatella ashevillensis TaxID=2995309 RepID=A0ABT5D6A2_9BACT|nr:DUF6310 domain-containing protein [Stigmatella ashevillena]MDC0707762.1 DUF6310 domain-containing protein [Stigmatella ashevillena]
MEGFQVTHPWPRRQLRDCFGFIVGVSTQAHKDALLQRDESLKIVVTGCKR